MKAIIRRSIPAAVTAVVVAGAAVTIPAVAATDDGDDTTQAAVEERPAPFGLPGVGHRLGHGLEEGEFAARLADELGLDDDTVQGAIDAVKADLLDERLAEAVADGHLTPEQADALAAAIADGDREAAGEILREARLAGLEARLAERVEAGELTQDEADELLERAQDGDLPRRHGRHGRRGPGPHGGEGPGPSGSDAFTPPIAGEDASV